MSQLLQNAYDIMIADFENQNKNGRGEVDFQTLVRDPSYTKTEEKQGVISWLYTRTDGNDKLIVHYYCYDRCKAFQIEPDGNRLTVSLTIEGETKSKTFSWLDQN